MGYPKEVYDEAWQKLHERKEKSRFDQQSRQAEAFRKLPQVAEIQRLMAQTAASVTKSVLSSPNNAKQQIEKLAQRNLELQEERKKLLESAGYPHDYLAEKYFCEKCSDNGYIGTQKCECFEQLLKQAAFTRLNYVCDGGKCSFREFRLDMYTDTPAPDGVVPRQRMGEIYEYCKEYARTFSKDSPSLLMLGKTGLGKTHLSLSIAWDITMEGFGVVYTPVQRLMDRLESQKFSYSQEDKEEYAQNIASVMECDLLVLDDLGTEFITSFTSSVIYNIVNSRLVEGRPTIINTNLDPSELESTYSQRMASRLAFGYKILKFYGEDIRFIMRRQKHDGK